MEAAVECIATKPRAKCRFLKEILAVGVKRDNVKTASLCNKSNLTNTNAQKLKKGQREITNAYQKEQKEPIQSQINKIRNPEEEGHSQIAWQTVNEQCQRKSTSKAKLKPANQEERIQMWKEYFKNLLGSSPKDTDKPIIKIIHRQVDIKLRQFNQELNVVLTKIKSRKAAGFVEILLNVRKTRKFHDLQLRFYNAVYN